MSEYVAPARLPPVLRDWFEAYLGFRGKTVTVLRAEQPITLLYPRRIYDYNDSKTRRFSVNLSTGEVLLPDIEDYSSPFVERRMEGEPRPLPGGPWALVSVFSTTSATVTVDAEGMALFSAGPKSTLHQGAAMLLYALFRYRGKYRARAIEQLREKFRAAEADLVFRDQLLEQGLVTVNRAGALTLTARGEEVGSKLSYKFDPGYWPDVELPEFVSIGRLA